jgi:methylphosphotriester-DNA--protein-cysteine methyltransferase
MRPCTRCSPRSAAKAISAEDFAARHSDALNKMSAGSFDYEILSALINNPYTAQVAFRLIYHTALVGDISRIWSPVSAWKTASGNCNGTRA